MPWPVATTVSGEIEPKQQALTTTANVPRNSADGAVVVYAGVLS